MFIDGEQYIQYVYRWEAVHTIQYIYNTIHAIQYIQYNTYTIQHIQYTQYNTVQYIQYNTHNMFIDEEQYIQLVSWWEDQATVC